MTNTPNTITVRIPKRFYDDHVARDLPAGCVVTETARSYVVNLDGDQYAELLDDARHYVWLGTTGDLDPEYFGLVTSARATVKALEGAFVANVPATVWVEHSTFGGVPCENTRTCQHRPGVSTRPPAEVHTYCLDCGIVLDPSCRTCGRTIVCPQPPTAGNPMTWRDSDGDYGDATHWHNPVAPVDTFVGDTAGRFA